MRLVHRINGRALFWRWNFAYAKINELFYSHSGDWLETEQHFHINWLKSRFCVNRQPKNIQQQKNISCGRCKTNEITTAIIQFILNINCNAQPLLFFYYYYHYRLLLNDWKQYADFSFQPLFSIVTLIFTSFRIFSRIQQSRCAQYRDTVAFWYVVFRFYMHLSITCVIT